MKNINKHTFTTILIAALLLLASTPIIAQAPDFSTVLKGGGTGEDGGNAIAVDANGNTYITGYFLGSATFGNTTLTSTGLWDVFVVKYNAAGVVQWAAKGGGPGEDRGIGIAVDGSGNIYITGRFDINATFGNFTLTGGDYEVFVVKYDAAGVVQWAVKGGGPGDDRGQAIAVDGSGNTYITGLFDISANFGNITLTGSGWDVFVAKYNAAGVVQWAVKGGGPGDDRGAGIAVDGSGNCYVTGFFGGSATFATTTLTSTGSHDVFVAKYNDSGVMEWAVMGGGTGIDEGAAIAVDGNGNSYITGQFIGSPTFGTTTLTGSGSSDWDLFVVKYDAAGAVQWAVMAGGPENDQGFGIGVDDNGNSYITGRFSGSATFGNTTLTGSDRDVFVVKHDAAGVVQWAVRGGGTSFDSGNGIAVDGIGNSYVTGSFIGSATFGNTTIVSSGSSDIFTARLGTLTGTAEGSTITGLTLYPNPFSSSFHLALTGTSAAQVVLTDMLGRELHRQVILPDAGTARITPPANLQPGLYLLLLMQDGVIRQQRVLRQ